MATFFYKALTEDGRVIEGVKNADSVEDVLKSLEQEGLLPLTVKEKKESSKRKLSLALPILKQRVSKKDVIFFTQTMAMLIKSGVPVDKALLICIDINRGKAVEKVLEDLLDEVRQGSSLSDALSKYPSLFSRLYVNTVKAGESTGLLGEVLERTYLHLSKMEEFKSSIVNSLIYPLFLILTSVVSIVVLIVFVVPRFYAVLSSSGVAPPFPIPQLASLGEFCARYGFFVLVSLILFMYLFSVWYTKVGRDAVHGSLIRFPAVGTFLIKMENAKFGSNFGTLLKNGVPILQALVIVKEMFFLEVYREEMERLYKEIREGRKLTLSLKARKDLWHPLVVGLGEVGEETGELGEALIKAADILEAEISTLLNRLISIVEPATILAMGVIVGGIVISMINAIFSINEMVR